MKLLNGKDLSGQLEAELKNNVDNLKAKGVQPCLVVVLVGEDPASTIYVRRKQEACERLGINSISKKLPATTSEAELLELVAELNQDKAVHGILCQSPLPKGTDESKVFRTISAEKDVDCFHPYNMGLLALGQPRFMPCTPYGTIQILVRNGYSLKGKRVVVLGRSNIVGRPLSILLSLKKYNATVQLCHSATEELEARCREADILIAAIGKPEFVTSEFVGDGAIVIDVGINRIEDKNAPKGTRIVGDVAFEEVKEKTTAITPVPGGIGPMTISMLLHNAINAAALQNKLPKFELD